MNWGKRNYLILFTSLTLSCATKDRLSGLEGHWHRHPDFGFYETLDIGDSITITDKYVVDGLVHEFKRRNKLGRPVLPSDLHRYTENFNFENDTLTIKDSDFVCKYVRSNIKDCIIQDRYVQSTINIALAEVITAERYEISYKTFCSENLFVGKLRKGKKYFDSLTNVFPDSIFIETRDVFISLKDIPVLSSRLKDMCGEKLTNMNIHADSQVPPDFLEQIENLIPTTFAIHKVVRVKDDDIGLQRIR